jgi:error-prone DNA polymerase
LIAYASDYLKCHYLAAFTAAMLNNQSMGFYNPATLVKDAQRHRLKVRPIDVRCSDWPCTLEKRGGTVELRLGLRYARGLREEAARALVRERGRAPFHSIDEMTRRVPELRQSELVLLAGIGALNWIEDQAGAERRKANDRALQTHHRRDALWQVERASRSAGPLLEETDNLKSLDLSGGASSPLNPMTPEERLVADFHGTGMSVGPHPMAYHRAELNELGVRAASNLSHLPDGKRVRVAGCVIARQRPGTAKGFVFLSLEDETGIANAIITPDLFEHNRLTVVHEQFVVIEGKLQNLDNVISVKADRILPLDIIAVTMQSHYFH